MSKNVVFVFLSLTYIVQPNDLQFQPLSYMDTSEKTLRILC
jgi:hypothetical protein